MPSKRARIRLALKRTLIAEHGYREEELEGLTARELRDLLPRSEGGRGPRLVPDAERPLPPESEIWPETGSEPLQDLDGEEMRPWAPHPSVAVSEGGRSIRVPYKYDPPFDPRDIDKELFQQSRVAERRLTPAERRYGIVRERANEYRHSQFDSWLQFLVPHDGPGSCRDDISVLGAPNRTSGHPW
jgi:hypothetical protein